MPGVEPGEGGIARGKGPGMIRRDIFPAFASAIAELKEEDGKTRWKKHRQSKSETVLALTF